MIIMMMGYGHGWAIGAIVALVVSTAFLVWLGGKEGNPYQKFGKVIAWIAIGLSSLLVLASVIMCISSIAGHAWPPCMKGGMMQEMWEHGPMQSEPGRHHPGMGPGMGMHEGFGPPESPPPEHK